MPTDTEDESARLVCCSCGHEASLEEFETDESGPFVCPSCSERDDIRRIREDERYGRFHEHPHTVISLDFGAWNEGAQPALGMRLGPPIAWEYDGGSLFLWGEHLDEKTLSRIADACSAEEQEHADMGIYDAAQNADRAGSYISRAEINDPVDAVVEGNA